MNRSNRSLETEIADLRRTLRTLRGPRGCPWDREQRLDDLISYLIDEAYELLRAEQTKNWAEVEEELGDVFFVLVFIHELLLEERRTSLARIVARVHRKIVMRHPHVFGTAVARTSTESLAHWNRIKRNEKGKHPGTNGLERFPRGLPPLRYAAAVQKKASEVGFDWPDHTGILDKIREEVDELADEIPSGNRDRIKDEIGDILFTVVNLTRRLEVDPEGALEKTTEKFVRRYAALERAARRAHRDLSTMSLDEMQALWERGKRTGTKRREAKGPRPARLRRPLKRPRR
jgi:tetrapyrrole methylase family protein/MazG family protein